MKQNVIVDKTFDFSVRIIRLCDYVRDARREYILTRQLLRSGTSIGANVEEAVGAISRPDFINKMQIAYKEARETRYWIRLMIATDYLNPENGNPILQDAEEILRILIAILNSSKQ